MRNEELFIDNPEDDLEEDNLPEWLQVNDGIYTNEDDGQKFIIIYNEESNETSFYTPDGGLDSVLSGDYRDDDDDDDNDDDNDDDDAQDFLSNLRTI